MNCFSFVQQDAHELEKLTTIRNPELPKGKLPVSYFVEIRQRNKTTSYFVQIRQRNKTTSYFVQIRQRDWNSTDDGQGVDFFAWLSAGFRSTRILKIFFPVSLPFTQKPLNPATQRFYPVFLWGNWWKRDLGPRTFRGKTPFCRKMLQTRLDRQLHTVPAAFFTFLSPGPNTPVERKRCKVIRQSRAKGER